MIGRIVWKDGDRTVRPRDVFYVNGVDFVVERCSYSGRQGARVWTTCGNVFSASDCGAYHTSAPERATL